MLSFYRAVMRLGTPALRALLRKRATRGKENPARLGERRGKPSRARPDGPLLWVHAASMGESQSALIMIERLASLYKDLSILVTTGTLTSAALMEKRLPQSAFHQFYPLDHPDWVARFLSHWHPDAVLWMESELWPCMLTDIRNRKIPAALINGRLSPESFRRWKRAPASVAGLLSAFRICLVQTAQDAAYFRALGARAVTVTDNIKYSAQPLPAEDSALAALETALAGRPRWLYASSHDGEEDLACRVHLALKKRLPDILTLIVPRHPHRGKEVMDTCLDAVLDVRRRAEGGAVPAPEDDVYVADTLGELGLFYRLCPVACVGRSFSRDGGGGHNPVEPALLRCAVLHGPNVQNLASIYEEMDAAGAARLAATEAELSEILGAYLSDPDALEEARSRAKDFAAGKSAVLETVMAELAPLLQEAGLATGTRRCA